MSENSKVLALIPARSGSKGLPDKNIKTFRGKPLLTHSVETACKSDIFTDVIVSTDSKEYAGIAREAGAEVPFLRPSKLATDDASALDVYLHTLEQLDSEFDRTYDRLFVLQPTSPLREPFHLKETNEMLKSNNCKGVVSVCELEHPLEWVGTLPDDRNMEGFLDSDVARSNRQDLSTRYRLNGAIFTAESDYFIERESFYGNHTYAYLMSQKYSIDIDTKIDFEVAECMATKINQGDLK